MATYNSAGSGNFNADATWTESGQPSTDDVAVIASGHTVTMTADASVGSIDIQGTLTTDGTARTLTLDDGGQGYICEHRGTVSTTINLTINSNFAGDRLIRLNNGGNGNFNNVSITLQSTSRKLTIGTEAASIGGNLTIAQGEFNTDSSNNYALTVTGEMHSQGTFTSNSSTVTVRNLLIEGGTFNAPDGSGMLNITGEGSSGLGDGYAFRRVSGAFVDNTGTVTFKTPTTTSIRMGTAGQDFYNVIFDESSAGGVYSTNDEGFTVTNDCTLTDGDFDTTLGTATPLIDIQGDLSIGANNTFGGITQTQTSDISFGSVTIASGGTFIATSGTTTITSEPSSGFNLSNSGTFTHNKGTVKVTCATQTTLTGFSGSNAFFNFTYAGTGSGQDQICGASTDFFGQVVIDSANSELQMQQHTFNLYDGIRIKQGGWDIGSSSTSGTINVYGAVRNVGGTVVAS